MDRLGRHRTLLLTLLVMIGGTVLCAAVAGHVAGRRAMASESAQVQRQLQLYAQGLQQRIDRFGTLPQVLALDPDLVQALRHPEDAALRHRLNLKLEQANQVTRASTLHVVGRDGVAIAAAAMAWPSPPATGTSRRAMSARTTATGRTTARRWPAAMAGSTASA